MRKAPPPTPWTPPTQAPPQTPRPRTPPIASLRAWPWVPSSDLRSGLRRSSITTCHRWKSSRCPSRGEVNMPFSPALSSKSHGKVWGKVLREEIYVSCLPWLNYGQIHATEKGAFMAPGMETYSKKIYKWEGRQKSASKFLIWIGRCHINR